MPFTPRTAEEILAEIWSWSKSKESQVEGTFTYDVYASNSLEFMKVELELAECYRAGFAQTSWGEYLTMRAAEHGVIRRPSNKAIGTLTVTANSSVNAVTLPAGSLFSTEAGTRFVTTETVTFTGTVDVSIEAVNGGDDGNVAAGTIIVIPLSIPGIAECTNAEATYDGFDEEDDDTLRERFLDVVQRPATSGNPTQYTYWAMSIVGVGAARCVRTPRGPGTVDVIITDANFEPANDELIARVKEYIDTQRPVGILDGEVHVISAQPYVINIAADTSGIVDEAVFRTGLQNYFNRIIRQNLTDYQSSQSGGVISVAQIGALIIKAGADTYNMDTMLVNGDNDDIELDVTQLPRIGEINLY